MHLPAGRGAQARAHLRPVAALRRRAAGRAPGHAAAHERRCVAAEGLGLISILGVVDAVQAARIETSSDFNYTPYVVAGVLFICLTIPMARLTDWAARRQGYQGAGGLL